MATPEALADAILRKDARAAARAITLVESGEAAAAQVLARIHPHTGNAHVIGVTGAPGTGKSTLVDRLIDHYRAAGETVGVVAVDPTSPFTGGAILGDRIRMTTRSTDPDVFIRSMATRGALGGLSRHTHAAIRVLDAMGKDRILVETVGVGQGEIDIVRTADTVALVLVPGLGDDIQTIKAGIMEIADLFCVNKADRPDADRTVAELQAWLRIAHEELPTDAWRAPILQTIAQKGDGIRQLAASIDDHRDHLKRGGALAARRTERARQEILSVLRERLERYVLDEDRLRGTLTSTAEAIVAGKVDPATAAQRILDGWRDGP